MIRLIWINMLMAFLGMPLLASAQTQTVYTYTDVDVTDQYQNYTTYDAFGVPTQVRRTRRTTDTVQSRTVDYRPPVGQFGWNQPPVHRPPPSRSRGNTGGFTLSVNTMPPAAFPIYTGYRPGVNVFAQVPPVQLNIGNARPRRNCDRNNCNSNCRRRTVAANR